MPKMRLFIGAMCIRLRKRSHNALLVPVFSQFLDWEFQSSIANEIIVSYYGVHHRNNLPNPDGIDGIFKLDHRDVPSNFAAKMFLEVSILRRFSITCGLWSSKFNQPFHFSLYFRQSLQRTSRKTKKRCLKGIKRLCSSAVIGSFRPTLLVALVFAVSRFNFSP